MSRVTSLEIRGFKSIRDLPTLELRPLNVFIGANGAGKSNLVSFFRMLSYVTAYPGSLQVYVNQSGRASSLLFDGPDRTPHIEATVVIETDVGSNGYSLRLAHAAGDTLIFTEERYRFSRFGLPTIASWRSLGAGHRESRLLQDDDATARTILGLLRECKVYQFHNTSDRARIRATWDLEDHRYLKEDGANLAPFLHHLRNRNSSYYRRITDTIRQAAPFFADFVLDPEEGRLLLRWTELGTDVVFGSHQASDGSLRWFALMTLLLQPEDQLPDVLILDEPELGLHPFAINLLAGALKAASQHCQILICTQSVPLIDHFEPEDIIVVDRPERESRFHRLDPDKLKDWLKDYSLPELWEKNVIGGRP